jgi:hypothetical protein
MGNMASIMSLLRADQRYGTLTLDQRKELESDGHN